MKERVKMMHRLAPHFGAMVLVFAVAGCGGNVPTPTPSAVTPSQAVATARAPAANAAAAVEPDKGGTIALETGADLTFPPQSVSAVTRATFRTEDRPAPVPVPRSHIGPAYAVELDGGELTGIALIRLPLPPGVNLDGYDLAPYRWSGTTWERVTGRIQDGYLQFGVSQPGTFSMQGQWRHADAAIALIKAGDDATGGTIPVNVVGQYRFSALPLLNGELVSARLVLKQDSSGGAGLSTGLEELDTSVEEAPLLFKPDPGTPRGLIEFTHVFELRPDLLDVMSGSSTRFYAVLYVADSAAPTRRLSSGIEYTQVLPVRIVGKDVVRGALANESRYSLRWNVTRDGAPFYQEQAVSEKLPIQPLLDKGGLGDYRVVLEVEHEGSWIPVSNEVTFQLALRPSATPLPGQEPRGTQIAITQPTATATLLPAAIPVPPTRRPTPLPGSVATPTATPTLPFTPTATASPVRMNGTTAFWADKTTLSAGECANLSWQVENVIAVFLDGAGVEGRGTRQVCPTRTTTYTLRVQASNGTQDRTVTLSVVSPSQPGEITFTADVYQVAPGSCAVLTWRAVDVRAVFLNNQGVAGEASLQVCPTVTTLYTLRVDSATGASTTRTLTIVVSQAAATSNLRFWAEQYTLPPGACTTLHWKVQNVRQVFLDEQGVPGEGSSQACPAGTQFYTLRVIDLDSHDSFAEVTLVAGDPGLMPNEIIAQGLVSAVTNPVDIDPTLPGEQAGYVLNIDGLVLLYAGANGFAQPSVSLRFPLEASFESGPIDWPIRSGQQVEFRAMCQGATCEINLQTNAYLYLRSE